MRRFAKFTLLLPAALFVSSVAMAQDTSTTPAASQTTVDAVPTAVAGTTSGATSIDTPVASTSTQVDRTVVSDHSDAGKWGLLGLLGLLGLAGLRRREGEVTVVNPPTTRSSTTVDPVPPVRR